MKYRFATDEEMPSFTTLRTFGAILLHPSGHSVELKVLDYLGQDITIIRRLDGVNVSRIGTIDGNTYIVPNDLIMRKSKCKIYWKAP